MPAYDATRFDPPAPVAEVVLRDSQTRNTIRGIAMLLDTGADITLLPKASVDELGVIPIQGQSYVLMGYDGTTNLAPVVQLDLIFLNRIFRGRYLLIDQEYGILGRDVLNLVCVLLEGPHVRWAEHQSH